LFADVSGFTRYIDAAESDIERKTALCVLHAIRKEMASVVKSDFGGLRIQYQGDRVQALFHLPKDDEQRIARRAVETAIGLQSSMEHTIKEVLPEAKELKLAIGIGLGKTLVSKLGTRGQRDRICLGEAVELAAQCEEKCTGGQIGITKQLYELLPEDLQIHFAFNTSVDCYTGNSVTLEKVEAAAKAAVYAGTGAIFLRSGKAGVQIGHEELTGARSVTPSRSWAE
jgi:class 3 adenylate cyclase